MRILFGLVIWILGACAPIKIIESPRPGSFTLEEFLKEQSKREQDLSAVEGKLRVRFSTRQGAVSGAAKFIKYNEQSRFEVSDPMGRVRYWLVGQSKRVFAFYETERTAYFCGEEGEQYFQKFYGIRLKWPELQNLWLGILPKSWRENLAGLWEYQSGAYRGRIKQKKDLTIDIEISEKNHLLSRIVFKGDKKNSEFKFSDFDACCSREKTESVLGHGVEINLPDPSEKIELEWEELNILGYVPNPDVFSENLPKGSKIIKLEKEKKHEQKKN